MTKLFVALAAVAAPMIAAAPAEAAKYVIANDAPGSFTFGNTGNLGTTGAYPRSFSDVFDLIVTFAGAGTVSVLANGAGRQDVDFTSLSLSGPGITGSLSTSSFENDPGDTGLISFTSAPGTYRVTVNGTAASRDAYYTGSFGVTPAAVPEPATWAMMIGGIGVAGGALRRRRSGALQARTA